MWFLFPADLRPLIETLKSSKRFEILTVTGPPRFFAVDVHGYLTEQWVALPSIDRHIDDVLQSGLRQLFRDSESLALSAAGFHFAHPSGKHSEYFIRASQAVSRRHHSYFVAMTLLRRIPIRDELHGDGTIWVDTASISSLGYAYADLLRRGGITTSLQVESFGGHDGVDRTLKPGPADIVFVSGSTSGTLSDRIIKTKGVAEDQIVTLFYLAEAPWDEAKGLLLCNLTSPEPVLSFSVRESRLDPYDSFDASDCSLCNNGRGVVVLEGDSFFPAATQMELRMPIITDRPHRGITGPDRPKSPLEFDGQDFFLDLAGAGALKADKSPHGVSTKLGHLLAPASTTPAARRILAKAKSRVGRGPVAILSLNDKQSVALGRFLSHHFFGSKVTDDKTRAWREWRKPGLDRLEDANGGTVLIVAAVIASGRSLTDLSRELRVHAGKFHPEYLIAAAHPESSSTWDILKRGLERVTSAKQTQVTVAWKIPRQPRSPGTGSPWIRERATLNIVHGWLADRSAKDAANAKFDSRLTALNAPHDKSLFVGALDARPIPDLNKGFALWPKAWEDLPGSPCPTHPEIYATVAHLMYESRHRNAQLEKRSLTVRRHGYALHPSMFDRFNDPVIQAAILRAAEPGELHYSSDLHASAAVANLLLFVLKNVHNEAGAAAYEFLLALSQGMSDDQAHGLRIHDECLEDLLREVTKKYGDDFEKLQATAPQVRALLLFVQARGKN
ncbi:hypothetical protein [Microbacterium sp. Root553]|uniref:hypothetical protein n=1 Tax=Microbacterium sp. Root553 TaxID=1736556 RepID=UPI0012F97D87|nr:hypothetical protein [Microbacterium sp. Root553]